jgi:hypothetical protein
LHHFVDIEEYQRAVRAVGERPKDKFRIVYTGTISVMLKGTMEWLCRYLNQGIEIDGRPVELSIYAGHCPPGLVGPRVFYRGFVRSDEIPRKLAESDVTLSVSAFEAPPDMRQQVQTSVGTKTADYLASGRPMLLIAPQESALWDYCQGVAAIVDTLDIERVRVALTRLANDPAYGRELGEAGLRVVRERHSLEALDRLFLSHFRTAS